MRRRDARPPLYAPPQGCNLLRFSWPTLKSRVATTTAPARGGALRPVLLGGRDPGDGGMRRESQSRVRDARIVPPLVACLEIQSGLFRPVPGAGYWPISVACLEAAAAESWIFFEE